MANLWQRVTKARGIGPTRMPVSTIPGNADFVAAPQAAYGSGASLASRLLGYIGFYGFAGGALGTRIGAQYTTPSANLVDNTPIVHADTSLQLATIWACVERRANIIASLPLFTYNVPILGPKQLAGGSQLYQLLHDSPNPRMTPFQFWRAMVLNHDLRGNGYARIERATAGGPAVALWPMAADQVKEFITPDGEVFYLYSLYNITYVYLEEDVLHIKNLGNGNTGLSKLEFMAATINENASQQSVAAKTFSNGGKPTAVLMTDKVLRADQRQALQDRFTEMATGSNSRLYVLEADMKYEALSATAEQMELLESRRFSVEEICRWFDVPPVLVHHSNVTTWGSGIEQIIEGFHKFTIAPLCVSIEQSVRKRVMTPAQRASMSVEFSLDALLRGAPKARYELYAQAVQNGVMTRNECRQLENLPAQDGADDLTAQSNLMPLGMLGKQPPATGGGFGASIAA